MLVDEVLVAGTIHDRLSMTIVRVWIGAEAEQASYWHERVRVECARLNNWMQNELQMSYIRDQLLEALGSAVNAIEVKRGDVSILRYPEWP